MSAQIAVSPFRAFYALQESWSSCMDCELWFLFEYSWSCSPSDPSKSDVQTLLYRSQDVAIDEKYTDGFFCVSTCKCVYL